jgi:hypothetical protein
MVTLAIVGGSLAILLITVASLVWVSRRSNESPEQRRLRARRDHDKSRKWLHGPAGGSGDGYSGCAGGGPGFGGGGDS